MTTNKQLQEWLKRFPDDAEIKVLTSEDNSRHYSYIIDVYVGDIELPDVQMKELKWSTEFKNVVFDIEYDTDKQEASNVKSITLGKHHND